MKHFAREQLFNLHDRGKGLLLSDMHFEECLFQNCFLSLSKDFGKRTTVKNVEITSCAAIGCSVGPAVIEDVRIDGLSVNDLLIVWGAVFSRVTLRGLIGRLKINRWVHPSDRGDATQGPFDSHRNTYYNSIDWALDISGASFKEFEISGVPSRLIRRDGESQMVVTRERAMSSGWREKLSPSNTLWPFAIDLFISRGEDDTVLVAPLGAPKEERDMLLAGLRELRALGVAVSD